MRATCKESYSDVIRKIEVDLRSRDDIPALIRGLQHIYMEDHLRMLVFSVLKENHFTIADVTTGRPGMDLWRLFVLAVFRVNLNWDYDRLTDMLNNHLLIRQIFGHEASDTSNHSRSTIRDNFNLIDDEIITKINTIVVSEGHRLLGERGKPLKGRCDSFVVESNVHFPTDINLLFDALRKCVHLGKKLARKFGCKGFREYESYLKKIKAFFNKARNKCKGKNKGNKDGLPYSKARTSHHKEYIDYGKGIIEKCLNILNFSNSQETKKILKCIYQLRKYTEQAKKLIDQIQRRVLEGKSIPNEEKIYSVFETFTEWLSKGKAKSPVELGLNVCLIEDQYGFILNHRVMQDETDPDVAVKVVKDTKSKFENLSQCSFDRGFYSQENLKELSKILNMVVMPKKGYKSKDEIERESQAVFVEAKNQHCAVESAINAIENHGLDRCPDRGLLRFKRYVAVAVVARNILKIGTILIQKERMSSHRLIEAA